MCIAILNRKGALSRKILNECWNNNPDGAGLAFFNGRKIVIEKELKSFKCFYRTYTEHKTHFPDTDFLIHFRIATHGKINETNCHPFRISKTAAFIHNGIISRLAGKGEFSDTHKFNELVIKKLPANWMRSEPIIEMMQGYIGYSKLVFLFGETSLILNEDFGIWDKGNWFSNDTYKPLVIPAITYTRVHKNCSNTNKVWDYDSLETYIEPKKEDERQYCSCCDEFAVLEYSNEFNIDMCAKCHKSYSTDYNKYNKFHNYGTS